VTPGSAPAKRSLFVSGPHPPLEMPSTLAARAELMTSSSQQHQSPQKLFLSTPPSQRRPSSTASSRGTDEERGDRGGHPQAAWLGDSARESPTREDLTDHPAEEFWVECVDEASGFPYYTRELPGGESDSRWAEAGDWVKNTDPDTGFAYWFNQFTGETAWDHADSLKTASASLGLVLHENNGEGGEARHEDTSTLEPSPINNPENVEDAAAPEVTTPKVVTPEAPPSDSGGESPMVIPSAAAGAKPRRSKARSQRNQLLAALEHIRTRRKGDKPTAELEPSPLGSPRRTLAPPVSMEDDSSAAELAQPSPLLRARSMPTEDSMKLGPSRVRFDSDEMPRHASEPHTPLATAAHPPPPGWQYSPMPMWTPHGYHMMGGHPHSPDPHLSAAPSPISYTYVPGPYGMPVPVPVSAAPEGFAPMPHYPYPPAPYPVPAYPGWPQAYSPHPPPPATQPRPHTTGKPKASSRARSIQELSLSAERAMPRRLDFDRPSRQHRADQVQALAALLRASMQGRSKGKRRSSSRRRRYEDDEEEESSSEDERHVRETVRKEKKKRNKAKKSRKYESSDSSEFDTDDAEHELNPSGGGWGLGSALSSWFGMGGEQPRSVAAQPPPPPPLPTPTRQQDDIASEDVRMEVGGVEIGLSLQERISQLTSVLGAAGVAAARSLAASGVPLVDSFITVAHEGTGQLVRAVEGEDLASPEPGPIPGPWLPEATYPVKRTALPPSSAGVAMASISDRPVLANPTNVRARSATAGVLPVTLPGRRSRHMGGPIEAEEQAESGKRLAPIAVAASDGTVTPPARLTRNALSVDQVAAYDASVV
jgi:hypothetical protein